MTIIAETNLVLDQAIVPAIRKRPVKDTLSAKSAVCKGFQCISGKTPCVTTSCAPQIRR